MPRERLRQIRSADFVTDGPALGWHIANGGKHRVPIAEAVVMGDQFE
jgi:hypothetical protein